MTTMHLPSLTRGAAVLLASWISIPQAWAYPYDNTQSSLPSSGLHVGTVTRTAGTVLTFNIPISNWPDTLNCTLQGGDGGQAKAVATIGADKTAVGGGGLMASCTFAIDPTDTNALRPGGEIRIIVGSRGENKSRTDTSGAGGGGGTAILYRAPTNNASWELLSVAGGGGGGAASGLVVNTYARDGSNATSSLIGTDGGGTGGGSGGQSAGGGSNSTNGDHAGGGGGYATNGKLSQGGTKGGSEGGDGGAGQSGGSYGGFGCGGGGGGWNGDASEVDGEDSAGGGGGGYAGGGAGADNRQGGGGGSYMNTTRAITWSQTERTGSGSSGLVTFQAVPNPTNGNLAGPTITLNGPSSVTIYDFEAYTDAGATAVDIYGNSVSINLTTSTVIEGQVGNYTVTYQATDQFGKTGTGSRTVSIVSAHKPTFSLLGNLTRNEDSGAYSLNNFAFNFNANDSGQSLVQYQVSNNNNALFSVQPVIATTGNVSFTPAANANGTATVTVVAVDEPDDPINGSSNPVTFTITITSISDPPTTVALSATSVPENQTAIGTVTATEPFGAGLSYAITGGSDSSKFAINSSTGVLSFVSAPDYETPSDSNANNVYVVQITATGSDGSTNKTFNVTVTNANDAPVPPGVTTASVNENTTAIGTFTFSDPDGNTLTYSIVGGDDQILFSIASNSGALSFLGTPDFENPDDSGGTNQYHVSIKANDGTVDSTVLALTIEVLDVNEAPTAILLDGADTSSLSLAENAANATVMATLSASDPDANHTLVFSLTDDAGGRFGILNQTQLVLADNTLIDYETNTSHQIEVQVTDQGGLSSLKTLTVTIIDFDETTLAYFRSRYGLNPDGSDDQDDWSGNGISNILYYAFGLGDPNATEIDRSHLPRLTVSGDSVVFTYRQPSPTTNLEVTTLTSTDLENWKDISLLPAEEAATSTIDSEPEAGYIQSAITFPRVATERFFKVAILPPAP